MLSSTGKLIPVCHHVPSFYLRDHTTMAAAGEAPVSQSAAMPESQNPDAAAKNPAITNFCFTKPRVFGTSKLCIATQTMSSTLNIAEPLAPALEFVGHGDGPPLPFNLATSGELITTPVHSWPPPAHDSVQHTPLPEKASSLNGSGDNEYSPPRPKRRRSIFVDCGGEDEESDEEYNKDAGAAKRPCPEFTPHPRYKLARRSMRLFEASSPK